MSAGSGEPMMSALVRLLDSSHLATPEQVPAAAAVAARELGWSLGVYLVDYEQRVLIPIATGGTPGGPGGEPLGIDSSLAGLAFQRVRQMHGPDESERVWAPLVDGVERLGVLEITLPPGTDPEHVRVQERIRWLALLTAHLISVKMPYGDGLDRHRRLRGRTVAAELLWQLLPPLTFGCEDLVVSGVLEPCYEVAGDAFDYAVAGRAAHLMILDSTGHDLLSGTLSAAALAAARKCRREGGALSDTVRLVDDTIAEHFGHERFATAFLAELDLSTGELHYVNAGHPIPLVMREGRVVKTLHQGHRPMLGLGWDHDSPVASEQLEPDDRLILYSDGVTEARNTAGEFFGVDRLIDTLVRGAAADLPAPETLRRVTRAVLEYQSGVLQDDATMLIAEWASGAERRLYPR